MIPVPRLTWSVPREDQDPEDYESYQQYIVMQPEDERSIDALDALTHYPPESDRLTTDPFRENYKSRMDHLPRQPYHLSDMHVSSAKLVSLLGLLVDFSQSRAPPRRKEGVSAASLMALVDALNGEPSHIGWERFDELFASQTVRR